MKVLIVDDSDYKVRDLKETVLEANPTADVRIVTAFNPALMAIIDFKPHLVLLDMSIPTFDANCGGSSGRVRPFGGRDLLRELRDWSPTSRAVIITQFDRFPEGGKTKLRDDLMKELRQEWPLQFLEGLFYDATGGKWRDALRDILKIEALKADESTDC
jgi:CheY-like chemotaxis protein